MTYILKSESELRAETIMVPNHKGGRVKKSGTYLFDILTPLRETGYKEKPIKFTNRVPIVSLYPNCFDYKRNGGDK